MNDLTNQQFGRWAVLGRAGNGWQWRCVCACGTEKTVRTEHLLSGRSSSCGCLREEIASRRSATHGHTRGGRPSPEYNSWQLMRRRCNDPNDPNYPEYGGAGVTVCDRWNRSFEDFLSYMGKKLSPRHTVDRWPNPYGNYEPGNVRWGTPRQQANNRRSNRRIKLWGRTQTVAEWAHEAGIPRHIVYSRLTGGWPVEALLIPAGASSLTCTWIDGASVQQGELRRLTRLVTIDGRTQSAAAWAREAGISVPGIHHRLKLGWPPEALLTPPGTSSITYMQMTAEPTR
jgi:hypothetical protein